MRPSLVLLVLLAVVTIGLRIWTGDDPPVPDQDRFQAELAERLDAQWFVTERRRLATLRSVEAQRDDCSLVAAASIFHGAKYDAFIAERPEGTEVHVFYEGWHSDYPRLRPLLAQYAQRYLTTFGLSSSFAPVVLVAASPACDLESLPITDMRMHFGG